MGRRQGYLESLGMGGPGRLILVFLRTIAWTYYLLPQFLRRLFTGSIGVFLYLMRFRRKVIQENLNIAYPINFEGSAKAHRRLMWDAYQHLSQLSFEILMLLGPMPRFAVKNGELRGKEIWEEAKKRGKGVIFLSGHVGNWE